jgi:hypothetical protein
VYPEVVEITPSRLSKGGSMHQKQPPAKIATAVACSVSAAAMDAVPPIARKQQNHSIFKALEPIPKCCARPAHGAKVAALGAALRKKK